MSKISGKPRSIITALALAALSYGLMQSFLTPLLPLLSETFEVDESGTAWLVSAFLLSASIATPIAGRLGDIYGRTRVLRIVSVLFAVGTVLVAIADNYAFFFAARLLQGIGGALFPLAFGIFRERFSTKVTAGAIGLISSLIAVGSGIGASAAGPIASLGGYHSVFLVAAVVAVGSTVFVWWFVPPGQAPEAGEERIGWWSAVTLTVWLVLLLVVIAESQRWGLTSATTILVFAGAAAFAVTWIFVESNTKTPVINVFLMRNPVVAWANLLAFAIGYLLFAAMVVIPTYVQSPREAGFGFSASISETAIYMVPQTIMFLTTSLLAHMMHAWPGSRASTVLGAVLSFVGCGVFVVGMAAPAVFMLASAILGAGLGLIYSHLTSILVEGVRPVDTSAASGLNANIRNIGGAIGVQISAGVTAILGGADGYIMSYVVMTAVAFAAIVISIMLSVTARASALR